jgi:hypothetical protein
MKHNTNRCGSPKQANALPKIDKRLMQPIALVASIAIVMTLAGCGGGNNNNNNGSNPASQPGATTTPSSLHCAP